jgi:hypothetical protein
MRLYAHCMSHPLQPIRDYYLDGFRKSIADALGELDQFATELLLEIPSLKHPDYCYRLYRADIIGQANGETKIREVRVGECEVTGWRSALPANVSVDSPLVWYGVEFEVIGEPPDKSVLLDWSSWWIDISDSRYEQSAEFQQVVHSVTPPTISESGFNISVDFGSAPTAAFDELTELLARDGRQMSVGSFLLFRSTT